MSKIIEQYGIRSDGVRIDFKDATMEQLNFSDFRGVTVKEEMTLEEYKKRYKNN